MRHRLSLRSRRSLAVSALGRSLRVEYRGAPDDQALIATATAQTCVDQIHISYKPGNAVGRTFELVMLSSHYVNIDGIKSCDRYSFMYLDILCFVFLCNSSINHYYPKLCIISDILPTRFFEM